MLFGESLVRLLVITADPDDLCAEILEFLIRVSKPTSFCRTTSREIFRIKVNNQVLSTKVVQTDVSSIAIDESKIGRRVTYFNQGSDSPDAGHMTLEAA